MMDAKTTLVWVPEQRRGRGRRAEDRVPDTQQEAAEKVLNAKVTELLEATAKISAMDARAEERKRLAWVVGSVLTLVLVALVGVMIYSVLASQHQTRNLEQACSTRDQQSEYLVAFIQRARDTVSAQPVDPQNPGRKAEALEFYDDFLNNYPEVDCDF